jgi:conjugal transfer pilus assembly protein TraD
MAESNKKLSLIGILKEKKMKLKAMIKDIFKENGLWTEFGEGVNLDHPDEIIKLRVPDTDRKGHSWCFGTTRVGKTRLLENIIEQDIRKGYSVVAIDPKGDIDLFSKITQIAIETGRIEDLMLVTPIFPEFSAILDPLSSYYMPEELVAHITAGVPVGREPFYFGVAYEVSLVIVQALLELAKEENRQASFNLIDVKNKISHSDLEDLKEMVDFLETPEAQQISLNIQKILDSTADYYSKVASSLRVALTELTSGNIGKIIGTANENKFIARLEEGKKVILVVQLGSLLTKKASYTAGKVIVSMLQSFIGRRYASGKKIDPPLALHIDEAQSVLYLGIEDLFAKAGGANIYIHGYSQSVNQMYAEVGQERANSILDNCNTKIFMRVPDATTAQYVSDHLGETRVFSPMISLGGGLAIRETEDLRIKPSSVLNLAPRQFYLITYSGTYKGYSRDVRNAALNVVFPEVTTTTSRQADDA